MVTHNVNDGEPTNVGCGRNPANGKTLNEKSHDNPVAILYDNINRLKGGVDVKKVSLVGGKFGRLTVLSDAGVKGGRTYSNCLCDCGNLVVVSNKHLKSGHTKSCGCYKNEAISEVGKRTGRINVKTAQEEARRANRKHDMSGTRLYRIWLQMKQRCYNKNNDGYRYYGGKDISVCDEWKDSFETFEQWATSNGYNDKLTIDRINANRNYEPSNCRWITQSENSARIHRDIRYWCIDVCNGKYIEFDNIREFCRKHSDIATENHVRYAMSGKCKNQGNIIFGKF